MSEAATVCTNIGRAGRRRRTLAGSVMLLVGAALFAVLAAYRASPWARLWVGLPVAMAAVTLGQVTRSTCVALASKGLAEDDAGRVHAVDAALDRALRRTARGIVWRGLAIGVLVAGLAALSALA